MLSIKGEAIVSVTYCLDLLNDVFGLNNFMLCRKSLTIATCNLQLKFFSEKPSDLQAIFSAINCFCIIQNTIVLPISIFKFSMFVVRFQQFY